MSENKKKKKILNGTVIGVAQREITQRHGEAASQMIQALKGVRYDSKGGEIIHKGRSLEQISKYKVNPNNEYSNLKQQAGFSAELIKEARDNKKAILNNNSIRTRTTDGIGETNHQKFDHLKVDENNKAIDDTGSQMKFNGKYNTTEEIKKSSKEIVNKMIGEKWEKYENNPLDVPSEQFEHAQKYATKQAKELKESAVKYREKGDFEKAKLLEDKAEKYEKAKENLRDSGVKSKEAMEGRVNPNKFVAKEVIRDSHNAGIEAAKGTLIFSGAVSSAQNIYSVIWEDKPIDEAISDVTITAGKSSVMAYSVSTVGTAIKSMMHTSKNSVTRALGKTNAPAMMATATIEIGKSLHKYSKGEIDEEELLEELGEKGTGMIAASYGSALGTVVLPGVGTIIGGMIGYTISSLLYNESLNTLKNARISEERRKVIEKINEESIKQIKIYKEEIKTSSEENYLRREALFGNIFNNIDSCILNNDINQLFNNMNILGEELGVSLQFKTFNEFDEFMNDDETELLL